MAELSADLAVIKEDMAVIKEDVAVIKADVAVIKADVAVIKSDVADLKDTDFENRLYRRVEALVSRAFGLRRAYILQGTMQSRDRDFAERVEDALEAGLITDEQHLRIADTDFILRAQRRDDRASVWIAVEGSDTVDVEDIEGVRATAESLGKVFDVETFAVTVGYGIGAVDLQRASASGVRHMTLSGT